MISKSVVSNPIQCDIADSDDSDGDDDATASFFSLNSTPTGYL